MMITMPPTAVQVPSFLVGFRPVHSSFVIAIEIGRARAQGLQCWGWEQARLKCRQRF
jgi:hypothetical protein